MFMKNKFITNQNLKSFQTKLLHWYKKSHRKLPWRETDNPYFIWVSEVMLQQTQVGTVKPYYEKFIQKFPTVEALAKADLQGVFKIWEGMGYYSRARNLHRAAKLVIEEWGGEVPDSYREFRQLPGVGEYIAAAVQSIAFNQPYAVVDGNVKRVLARLFAINTHVNDAKSNKIFQQKASQILEEKNPGMFNQAVMELGALICRPQNPFCTKCPVTEFCTAFQTDSVGKYPVRKKRKPVPQYHAAIGVIKKNGKVLITKRKESGLLGGLWEFPGGKLHDGETAQEACIREIREEVNLKIEVVDNITQVKHAYTHFKTVMDVFRCRYISGKVKLNGAVDYRWITLNEIEKFPFPQGTLKFIPMLKGETADVRRGEKPNLNPMLKTLG
jgi:A/G-specific adenine glycosylase